MRTAGRTHGRKAIRGDICKEIAYLRQANGQSLTQSPSLLTVRQRAEGPAALVTGHRGEKTLSGECMNVGKRLTQHFFLFDENYSILQTLRCSPLLRSLERIWFPKRCVPDVVLSAPYSFCACNPYQVTRNKLYCPYFTKEMILDM